MLGIICRKIGMSTYLDEKGNFVPVTLLSNESNVITQIKTLEKDGYSAIQCGIEPVDIEKCNKPTRGKFASLNKGYKVLMESRLSSIGNYQIGKAIEAKDIFKEGTYVDACGVNKGKGFAGPVKRHGFATQPASHGTTKSFRGHGSTGQCQDPGRVIPGKKMAGRMGNVRVTVQNLKVIAVKDSYIVVKGSVPGPRSGLIKLTYAVKKGSAHGDN